MPKHTPEDRARRAAKVSLTPQEKTRLKNQLRAGTGFSNSRQKAAALRERLIAAESPQPRTRRTRASVSRLQVAQPRTSRTKASVSRSQAAPRRKAPKRTKT